MANVEQRGPYQFRVKVRRNGVSVSKTFESHSDAEAWARIQEGKITGEEYVDRSEAKTTRLRDAIEWLLDRIAPIDQKTGKRIVPSTQHNKNLKCKATYWLGTEFADWSIASITAANLVAWRRRVLDEDEDESEPECSAQTVVHRLNFLSRLYGDWCMEKRCQLVNPVGKKRHYVAAATADRSAGGNRTPPRSRNAGTPPGRPSPASGSWRTASPLPSPTAAAPGPGSPSARRRKAGSAGL